MYLHKDKYDEYKIRHKNLWPEMIEAIKKHGGHNYSIFLDEQTGQLFAYLEIEDEDRWNQLSQTSICKKWWSYMADIMDTNQDNSPVFKDIKSVFYLN